MTTEVTLCDAHRHVHLQEPDQHHVGPDIIFLDAGPCAMCNHARFCGACSFQMMVFDRTNRADNHELFLLKEELVTRRAETGEALKKLDVEYGIAQKQLQDLFDAYHHGIEAIAAIQQAQA